MSADPVPVSAASVTTTSSPDDAEAGVGSSLSRAESAKIAGRFIEHGFDTVDLTDDELSKQHVRHMVGGRSPLARDERLVRFNFPERPGALMRFLDVLGGRWNISLFHYRNHGADFGRVLAGFEVPPTETVAFESFLQRLGYPVEREWDNAAYDLFLR